MLDGTQLPNAMKTCAFCDADLEGRATREHILPEWLLKNFGIRETEITPTHFAPDGKTVSTRRHTLKNLVAGRICASCNNGWMSRLESEARIHLTSLFSNAVSVVELDEAKRFLVARWGMKTALTLNLGSNFQKNIPDTHYKHLRAEPETLPGNVVVFAQNHNHDQDFYWLQGAVWHLSDESGTIGEETVQSVIQDSYKIAFQLRGLLILIAYNPLPGFLFSMWRGIHVPLYPARGAVAWYDRDEFPWDDSQAALTAFHTGLGLARAV